MSRIKVSQPRSHESNIPVHITSFELFRGDANFKPPLVTTPADLAGAEETFSPVQVPAAAPHEDSAQPNFVRRRVVAGVAAATLAVGGVMGLTGNIDFAAKPFSQSGGQSAGKPKSNAEVKKSLEDRGLFPVKTSSLE